jgi:hypothetical protein
MENLMDTKKLVTFSAYLIIAVVISACGSADGAAEAVQAYFQALADKNSSELALLSCSNWEAQAKNELESFGAVTVSLDSPACEVSGEEAEFTLVSCSGKLVANYGNEVLEINLEDRTYLATEEGGDWHMCGYR